ncbi:MAG: MFS transporter [Candidatus Competibacteraceae bacterium]|nr:MFS transporter [Candidatus Competibacteraceae bacterium]HRY16479.1 MFS transporter [Candidatus Competibacteraceae bacterium]
MSNTLIMLLLGLGTLLVGNGLLGTLLGIRARLEGFTNTSIGALMAAYFLGYVMGTFLVPILIRRVGHIRAFAVLAALGSASVLCYGLMVHPIAWAVLRMVTGIAVLGVYMVVESWLNEQAPHHVRGQIFAIYMVVTLMGLAAGQYLILTGDTGALTLFAIASMLFTLGLVPIAATRVHAPQPQATSPVSLMHLFWLAPLAACGAFMAGIVSGAFWSLGAVFAQRVGLSEEGIALFMSATILGGAFLQWPIGRLSDYFSRRFMLTLVSFSAALVALLALQVMYESLTALIACAFLYGGLMFSVYSLSVALMNDRLSTPGEVLDATRGLLLIFGIGSIAGPAIGGPLMDWFGPGTIPAYSAATLSLLGLLGLVRLVWAKPIPLIEQGRFVPMVRTTPVVLEMLPQTDVQPELDLPPLAEDP